MAFDPRTQVPALHVVWADDPSWTAPANGAAVDSWRDHAGGALVQTDPVKRPIYVASEPSTRGHAVIRFDGVDDFLTSDVTDIPQPYKVVIVASCKSGVLEKMVGIGDTAARGIGHSAGAKWQLNAGTAVVSTAASDLLPHTFRATLSGAASALWVDGVQVIAADAGALAMQRLSVGAGVTNAGTTSAGPLKGDVAFVGLYSGATADADLAKLCDDLWTYYFAPVIPWTPDMPWPGSEGGAYSPHWGGYVRLFVRAGIASGNAFHLGTHAFDRLDSGNVLGGAPASKPAEPRAGPPRLWVDLTCDVLSLNIAHGASSSAGIFTKADAATCEVVLSDPDGIYDPATVQPPFVYAGRSRLVPGIPVEVFAEVVNPYPEASVTTHYLFTGTADSWREDWTTKRSSRRAVLVASDATKTWVRYDRPEQPAVGNNDTTTARVQRLVTYFGWPGAVVPGSSYAAVFAATTLAQSGWEMLGRTMDEELGVAYFTTDGRLRWTARADWFSEPVPILGLGCEDLAPVDFVETWDRPDSTDLGGEWREAVGDWGIIGGQAALLAHGTSRGMAYTPTASADGILSFAWGDIGAVHQQGVAFRFADERNYLTLAYVSTSGMLTITEYVNGTGATQLLNVSTVGLLGAGQRFLVELQGRTITLRNGATGALLGTCSSAFCENETGVGLTASTALPTTARWGDLSWTYTDAPLHDVLVDASPSSNDVNIRNVIRAGRPGGSLQTVTDQASWDAYGPYEYQRTDLGFAADSWVTSWANAVLLASAWPRIVLEDVTMIPAVDPASYALWPLVLDVDYVTDAVRVVWAPPDVPDAKVDQTARVVGVDHKITRSEWRVQWQLASLGMSPTAVTLRPLPVASDLVDA